MKGSEIMCGITCTKCNKQFSRGAGDYDICEKCRIIEILKKHQHTTDKYYNALSEDRYGTVATEILALLEKEAIDVRKKA